MIRTAVIGLAMAAVASQAVAQDVYRPREGVRVRLLVDRSVSLLHRPGAPAFTERDGRAEIVGRIVRMGPDTLALAGVPGIDSLSLPVSAISHLQLSQGRHRGTKRGLVIGLYSGGLAGAAALGIGLQDCESSCVGSTALFPLFIGGGAVAGMIIGAAVGTAFVSERWRTVSVNLLVGARPAPWGGSRIGLRFVVPMGGRR
jgi:hypothetical protein